MCSSDLKKYAGQTVYGSVPKGERAITYWSLLANNPKGALVLLDIKTGRTHQIRVHMSEMGHPVIGDYQYGTRSNVTNSQLLHAFKLVFIHPRTNKEIEVTAPLPKDFKEALRKLELVKKETT